MKLVYYRRVESNEEHEMSMTFTATDRYFWDARCLLCKGEFELPCASFCPDECYGQHSCPRCDYGYFAATGDLSFNVSNGSASLILAAIGMPLGDDECCKQLDPADVLVALHSMRARAAEFTSAATVDDTGHGVIMVSSGYDIERIGRYVDSLTALAHYALEEGTTIQVA
jgi:hypothetical protein